MAAKKTKTTTVTKTSYDRKGEKVSNFSVALKVGGDHDLIASWKHAKSSQAEGYEYDWEYMSDKKGKSKKAVWLPGSTGTIDVVEAGVGGGWFRHEWTAPDDAYKARCRIRPVSKTKNTSYSKQSGNKTTTVTRKYFSASWSGYKTHDFRKDKLPTPTVEVSIDDTNATIEVSCDDEDCNLATIEASVRNGKNKSGDWKYAVRRKLKDKKCDKTGSYTMTVTKGETWWFRAFCSTTKKATKGDSSWSSRVSGKSLPADVKKVKASATSSTAAKVTWNAASGASTYTAQYVADNPAYFNDNPEAVRTVDGIVGTTFLPTDLESGHKWYFRVRAVNDTGNGKWSGNAGTVLATVPDAPTTFETEPAFMRSDTARFRWLHNSEDESEQSAAQLRFTVGGTSTDISAGTDDHLDVKMSRFADGADVTWKVRTKGVHANWSPWSVARRFSVYAQPTLSCTARQTSAGGETVDEDNPLTSFPLAIVLDAAGGGGDVSGYHVSIIAAEPSSYVDDYGFERYMGVGEVAYQADYPVSEDPYTAIVDAGMSANLRDGCVYQIIADVSMQSGLRATADPWTFLVDWDVEVPEPTMVVAFDADTLTADIIPACYEEDEEGEPTETLFDGVTLSVYRIDDDGTLVLLRSGIENNGAAVITDPHAQFGECWYHVVATDTDTGVCNFFDHYDDSPHATCVIQWDESWQIGVNEDDIGDRDYDYSGMMIDGLYNLNLDESGNPESEDVEYVGRAHPVSYYGTQEGYEARFEVEFPKEDKDTLAKARKLIALRDDAYVREPYGTGYWAHVTTPSLSRSYDSEKLRLSFTARRVDRDDSALEIS